MTRCGVRWRVVLGTLLVTAGVLKKPPASALACLEIN